MKSKLISIKKITKQGKKLLAFLVSLLVMFIALSPASRGTLSFLFASVGPFANIFTIGTPEVNVEEPGVTDPDDVEWGENNKVVSVSVASDSIAGVVRVLILPQLKTDMGELLGQNRLGEVSAPAMDGRLILGEITLHFADDWDDYWFFKDGYFYCKTVVQPGTSAGHLLTGVTLTQDTPEIRAEYQKINVEIEIFAELIQATGGAPGEWGVTVSGGNVTAL